MAADKLHETWESVYAKSVKLAELIEAHCRDNGERFDALVVVPRGSYYPANIVARQLGFQSTDLLHACLSSYQDGQTKRQAFKFGQMPSAQEVKAKNLLIIEEVCDTGYTLDYLVKRFKEQGAGLIRAGVLHYKPAASQTGYQPDWVAAITNKWIVYPWELHEAHGKDSVVKRRH